MSTTDFFVKINFLKYYGFQISIELFACLVIFKLLMSTTDFFVKINFLKYYGFQIYIELCILSNFQAFDVDY